MRLIPTWRRCNRRLLTTACFVFAAAIVEIRIMTFDRTVSLMMFDLPPIYLSAVTADVLICSGRVTAADNRCTTVSRAMNPVRLLRRFDLESECQSRGLRDVGQTVRQMTNRRSAKKLGLSLRGDLDIGRMFEWRVSDGPFTVHDLRTGRDTRRTRSCAHDRLMALECRSVNSG